MIPRTYDATSSVEEIALKASGRPYFYPPAEKIKVIEVANFPALGKLIALRFIEWVLKNPSGVISLPTGKTPEHFIKWVQRILKRWPTPEIHQLLEANGIEPSRPPDMRSLRFVQIDEFYPMNAQQQNSFHYYVNEFYIRGFGLDPANALLIDATALGLANGKTMAEVFPNNIVDLSLRVRQTRTNLERIQKETINRVDEFCMEYESRIREQGGIGFFLGGIGPDGHIAFNVRGSSTFSVTRLTGTNYETQAAAATDLGGIEISRSRLVITIGLATITYNPTATAVVIAAGDAKAPMVADAIQSNKSPQYPASVLQDLPHARFYLTRGAAGKLDERRFIDFAATDTLAPEQISEATIALAVAKNKPLVDLSAEDFASDRFTALVLEKMRMAPEHVARHVREEIVKNIDAGLKHVSETTFLHTEPHHDDIMLAYMAHIYHLVRDATNKHYFANLTSGFTSVSNAYFLSVVEKLEKRIDTREFAALLASRYFDPANNLTRMEDVYCYLDGAAAHNEDRKDEADARRLLRNLFDVYRTADMTVIRLKLKELHEYLVTQYPGAKDPPDVQTLKGTLREFEVELLWAYLGIESKNVFPLRLGFYKGDIFSEEPEVDRDVLPIFELMKKVKPNVVSVAFDPEGSGPDTHYKALQAVAEAVRLYEKSSGDSGLRVWGYRNVWYRFKPSEANLMIPVSLNSLSMMHAAFMNCFGSQKAASFPSYEHDGPFSELAQKIQVHQYEVIKTCLGKDFFLRNEHPRLRAARGMIFLKEMTLQEFYSHVRELKKMTEG
jgi:glucosamine-6-phosphate deaminase